MAHDGSYGLAKQAWAIDGWTTPRDMGENVLTTNRIWKETQQ